MARTSATDPDVPGSGGVAGADPTGSDHLAGLAAALDHAPDLVQVTDAQGVCLYASRSASNVLGYPPQRLRGLGPLELTDQADQALLSQARATLQGGQDDMRVVHRARHADGQVVWLETRLRAVRRDGTLTAIVSISRDISLQHAAEQRAADADRTARVVLDALDEGVLLIDDNGRLVRSNEAAHRLLGLPSGLVGLTRDRFQVRDEHGRLLPETQLPSNLAQREGRVVERIVATRRPDGRLAYLRARAIPLGPAREVGDATVAVLLTDAVATLVELNDRAEPSQRPASAPTASVAQSAGLTQRELEVLTLLADGLAIKEIAVKLTLSEHTVRGHVKAVLAKLGASTQLKAVVLAMRAGLIPVPPEGG